MGFDLCWSGFQVGGWRQRDVVVATVGFGFCLGLGLGFVMIFWVDLGSAAVVGWWLCYW